jgi:hypothetical protein
LYNHRMYTTTCTATRKKSRLLDRRALSTWTVFDYTAMQALHSFRGFAFLFCFVVSPWLHCTV